MRLSPPIGQSRLMLFRHPLLPHTAFEMGRRTGLIRRYRVQLNEEIS